MAKINFNLLSIVRKVYAFISTGVPFNGSVLSNAHLISTQYSFFVGDVPYSKQVDLENIEHPQVLITYANIER